MPKSSREVSWRSSNPSVLGYPWVFLRRAAGARHPSVRLGATRLMRSRAWRLGASNLHAVPRKASSPSSRRNQGKGCSSSTAFCSCFYILLLLLLHPAPTSTSCSCSCSCFYIPDEPSASLRDEGSGTPKIPYSELTMEESKARCVVVESARVRVAHANHQAALLWRQESDQNCKSLVLHHRGSHLLEGILCFVLGSLPESRSEQGQEGSARLLLTPELECPVEAVVRVLHDPCTTFHHTDAGGHRNLLQNMPKLRSDRLRNAGSSGPWEHKIALAMLTGRQFPELRVAHKPRNPLKGAGRVMNGRSEDLAEEDPPSLATSGRNSSLSFRMRSSVSLPSSELMSNVKPCHSTISKHRWTVSDSSSASSRSWASRQKSICCICTGETSPMAFAKSSMYAGVFATPSNDSSLRKIQ
eukprot:scaffold836_cov239-Pinguiococcus_pyrenoidosus.AAC.2